MTSVESFWRRLDSLALNNFPASTVINKSAGEFSPSFFSLSISSSALALTTLTLIPVRSSKFLYCTSSTVSSSPINSINLDGVRA